MVIIKVELRNNLRLILSGSVVWLRHFIDAYLLFDGGDPYSCRCITTIGSVSPTRDSSAKGSQQNVHGGI